MTEKEAAILAKRKYPLTDKEKNCINEYGKLIIAREKYRKELLAGHLAKAKYSELKHSPNVIDSHHTPELNDSKATADILAKGTKQGG